jgi:hypothetical protein
MVYYVGSTEQALYNHKYIRKMRKIDMQGTANVHNDGVG